MYQSVPVASWLAGERSIDLIIQKYPLSSVSSCQKLEVERPPWEWTQDLADIEVAAEENDYSEIVDGRDLWWKAPGASNNRFGVR